jgi:hypothetical protein
LGYYRCTGGLVLFSVIGKAYKKISAIAVAAVSALQSALLGFAIRLNLRKRFALPLSSVRCRVITVGPLRFSADTPRFGLSHWEPQPSCRYFSLIITTLAAICKAICASSKNMGKAGHAPKISRK